LKKRFTDTEKWQGWFRKLSIEHKLLWVYINDACDCTGVWIPDFELAAFKIGCEIDPKAATEAFKDHIEVLKDGRWWISGFIGFQYGELSENCKPHLSILKALKGHGLHLTHNSRKGIQRVYKGYPKGIHTLEEKEKEKEKDKEQEKERRIRFKDRLNKLFNRRDSTGWSVKEDLKLSEVLERPEADLEIDEIERYYTSGAKFLRQDIMTLLNNWTGELDRARARLETPTKKERFRSYEEYEAAMAEKAQTGLEVVKEDENE